jgi:hypothetical protein
MADMVPMAARGDGEGPDDVYGEPACLLHRVCPSCGRLADDDPPVTCAACGALVPGDTDDDST